jgi:hypothetical protein
MDAVGAAVGNGQVAPAFEYDFQNAQIVTFGASAVSSTAFAQGYTVVTLTATANCWYRVNATAAVHIAGSDYLAAGIKFSLKMPVGATISVIQDSSAGFLAVLPCLQFPA